MIGRICLSLTLPLVLGAGQDEAPKGWKRFAPDAGGFAIRLPAEPTEGKRTVKTPQGEVEVTYFLVEVKGQGSYVVVYTEYPEEALKGGADEKRLDNARDGAVQSAKGKLKGEKRLRLENYPGRELVVESSAAGGVRTRLYAVNNRLYQTMAAGSRGFLQAKETEQFLNSFQLVR